MEQLLQSILTNLNNAALPVGAVLWTLFLASGLDLLTGAWAAWKSGSFDGNYLPAWISSHGDRIIRIVALLVAAVGMGGTNNPVAAGLLLFAGENATTYLGGVIASVKDNIEQGNAETKGAPASLEPATVVHNVFNETPLTDVASPDA